MNCRWYFILIIVLANICSAQKQAAQWRFGYAAGLNFQNGAPVAVNNCAMLAQRAASGISDAAGNLLFYVRGGDLIYNKNNDTMANGINIGGYSGQHASVVIPKIGSSYYVIVHHNLNYFYPAPFPPMVNYAIVDMSLASGLGSVTVSNLSVTPTNTPITNKLAATSHCNGKDYWLLVHRGGWPGSSDYYSYLVTSASISATPVISTIGSNQTQSYYPATQSEYWTHKFSPNGKKVCSLFQYRTVELYDFDNGTGLLSNVIIVDSANISTSNYTLCPLATNAEFSPDGSKLYVTYSNRWGIPNKHPYLCQFDLCAGSPSAIVASKTVLSFDTLSIPFPPASAEIQLAIDGKIYIANTSTGSLSVINNPNAAGIACNYSNLAVSLGTVSGTTYTPTSTGVLPNFISSYFKQKPLIPPITNSVICGNANFTPPILCAGAGYTVTGYKWNFGDLLSGNSNTSTIANPTHQFSANGTYTVKLVLQYSSCADTLSTNVIISGLPTLGVIGKSSICKGESTTLTFNGAGSYSINGGATSQNSIVVQPATTTTYTLSGSDALSGCSSLKTFTISVLPCTNNLSVNGVENMTRIFPNPNGGKFTIETELPEVEILIYNQLGLPVFKSLMEKGGKEFDLSEFQNGIYFVEIKNKELKKVLKLVKEE